MGSSPAYLPSLKSICVNGAGVMCIAFHPDYPNLLAVGCYDGSVLIFDVRSRSGKPLYQSTAKSGKHTEPVWQVRARLLVGREGHLLHQLCQPGHLLGCMCLVKVYMQRVIH